MALRGLTARRLDARSYFTFGSGTSIVVPPQVNKKPEVQHKCDDKNKSVVKVAPVTTAKTGTCNKK